MNEARSKILLCILLYSLILRTAHSLDTKQVSTALIQVEVPLSPKEVNLTCEPPDKLTATTYTIQFNCDINNNTRGGTPANSVHELKPSDISVVAALGDSISAGLFAKNPTIDICLMNVKPEYRGVSWSIGGDLNISSVLTLPNILRQYNPMIKGYSTGLGIEHTGLNMAVSGAKALDLPFQATRLVERLRSDQSIDFSKDWKIVTIFIGGNDLCKGCRQLDKFSQRSFYQHMKTTVDILSLVPRTYVNIAQVVDVFELKHLNTKYCAMMHAVLKVLGKCPCMTDSSARSRIAEYAQALRDLEMEYQIQDRDDFAVVIQPFFEQIRLGELEDVPSYFSGDCFHFSQKAHALSALLLWNNMLQPVGQKVNFFDSKSGIICADENQYFYTHRNSQLKLIPTFLSTLIVTICILTLVLIVVVSALTTVFKHKKYNRYLIVK